MKKTPPQKKKTLTLRKNLLRKWKTTPACPCYDEPLDDDEEKHPKPLIRKQRLETVKAFCTL